MPFSREFPFGAEPGRHSRLWVVEVHVTNAGSRSDLPAAVPNAADAEPVADIGGIPVACHGHLCVLYREQAERDQLVLDLVEKGLRAGDTCLYVATEAEDTALRKNLATDDPEVDTTWLDVRQPAGRYRSGAGFTPDGMLDMIGDWSEDAFERKGSRFARAVADMSVAMPHVGEATGEASVGGLAGYEARVARWSRAYPQIGVFFYDLNTLSGDTFVSMVRSHCQLWVGGVVLDNPYFVDPYERNDARGRGGPTE
jgi:hypothetical protein